MSDLHNKLREEAASGSGDGAAITSSDDIAFAPGSVFPGPVKPILPGLTTRWDDLKKKQRKKKIREGIDAKVIETKNAVIDELKKVVLNSKLTHEQFIKNFKYTRDLTPSNMMIGLMRKDTDYARFEQKLGDDVGELGLILNDIRKGSSLVKYEAFKNYDYLLGCRLQSQPDRTITMLYEGFMDQDQIERETIAISDLEIVEMIQERGFKNRIENNGRWGRIYPIDRYFDTTFYQLLSEVLNSDLNGGEDEHSTEETE